MQKVKLFRSNPEGVAMIKFKTPDTAQKCLTLMNGRWFGGRQLVAHLWVAHPAPCALPSHPVHRRSVCVHAALAAERSSVS